MELMKAVQLTWTLICTLIQKYSNKLLFKFWLWALRKEDFYWYADQHKHSDLLFAHIHKIHYTHSGHMQYMQISHPRVLSASDTYITQDFPRSPSIICGSPMLIVLVKKIYPTARAIPRIDIWAQGKYSMEICHMPEQRPHWGFVRGEYMDFLSIL